MVMRYFFRTTLRKKIPKRLFESFWNSAGNHGYPAHNAENVISGDCGIKSCLVNFNSIFFQFLSWYRRLQFFIFLNKYHPRYFWYRGFTGFVTDFTAVKLKSVINNCLNNLPSRFPWNFRIFTGKPKVVTVSGIG